MNQPAQQGHAYEYEGVRVLAMESGTEVEVAVIHDQWLGEKFVARVEDLEPLPMAYFHGQVPQ